MEPSEPGRVDDLGAPGLEELAALDRHVLGQDDLDRVALDLGDHGQGDAGVARRRLEDLLAGPQAPVLLRLLDHGLGRPVLDRAARVPALELGHDGHPGVRAEGADVDHRRVADQVEDALVAGHCDQPPATAGISVRVSRSADLGVELAEVADVVVVEEDVEVAVELAVAGQQLVPQTGVLADQVVEDLADGGSLRRDGGLAAGGRVAGWWANGHRRAPASPRLQVVRVGRKADSSCHHCRTTGSSVIFPSRIRQLRTLGWVSRSETST